MKSKLFTVVSFLMWVVIVCSQSSADEKSPIPAYSFDLGKNKDYVARLTEQMQILTLPFPRVFFLDNDQLAVTYADGEGDRRTDYDSPPSSQSPRYKFHVLIFNVNSGIASAKHLYWPAIRNEPQFLPTNDGGFVVSIDDKVMVYSNRYELVNEMQLERYGRKPLPEGEAFFSENFITSLSQTGKSLIVCHSLLGRNNSGGVNVTWYDTKTLKQIGRTSETTRGTGCGYYVNATDNAVYMGYYTAGPEMPKWKRINPLCIDCNQPVPDDYKYSHYDFIDDTHLLVNTNDPALIDREGHELYVTSSEKRMRIDHNYLIPIPHATETTRFAYDDGQSTDEAKGKRSIRIHVVDWQKKSKIAVIKVVQDKLPVIHGGGLKLEFLGILDLAYNLSKHGNRLAVIHTNVLDIYELP